MKDTFQIQPICFSSNLVSWEPRNSELCSLFFLPWSTFSTPFEENYFQFPTSELKISLHWKEIARKKKPTEGPSAQESILALLDTSSNHSHSHGSSSFFVNSKADPLPSGCIAHFFKCYLSPKQHFISPTALMLKTFLKLPTDFPLKIFKVSCLH